MNAAVFRVQHVQMFEATLEIVSQKNRGRKLWRDHASCLFNRFRSYAKRVEELHSFFRDLVERMASFEKICFSADILYQPGFH